MEDKYKIIQLPNGIRIIHQYNRKSIITHLGVMINTGSRDELKDEHGLAHFIEHCIFKGTKKRSSVDILNRLDNVGGELNAYTTKEETCYYASFINQHLERALELLADITFNSTFPEKELKKEREVVIEEIKSYLDSPSEQIIDDFEDIVFKGHELGRNILGTAKSLKTFNSSNLKAFTKRNYVGENMVVLCAGKHEEKEVVDLVKKYLGHLKSVKYVENRSPFISYKPAAHKVLKHTHQVHCVMGRTAFDINDPKRYALALLNNILGGPAMNSRLSLTLREKYGLTYDVASSYNAMYDTGICWIYFSCDAKNYEKAHKMVLKELKELYTKKLTALQLKTAKEQMAGHIALSLESTQNALFGAGRSLLTQGRIIPVEETIKKINELTSAELIEVAKEVYDINKLSELIYYPQKN